MYFTYSFTLQERQERQTDRQVRPTINEMNDLHNLAHGLALLPKVKSPLDLAQCVPCAGAASKASDYKEGQTIK